MAGEFVLEKVKILKIDNFDRDYIPHQVIAENVNKYYADTIVDALNKKIWW